MQTRREYLASKGLAIAGARGKFSNAAKAELARVEAAGMKFADAVTPTRTLSAPKSATAAPVQSAADSPYLYPSDFRYPEGEYVAKDAKGNKYSMRECCNRCKVSLTNHMCNEPSVLGISVTIVRR